MVVLPSILEEVAWLVDCKIMEFWVFRLWIIFQWMVSFLMINVERQVLLLDSNNSTVKVELHQYSTPRLSIRSKSIWHIILRGFFLNMHLKAFKRNFFFRNSGPVASLLLLQRLPKTSTPAQQIFSSWLIYPE